MDDVSEGEARAMLSRLEALLDPLSLRAWLVKRSNYGRKPSPAGSWGYVSEFVLEYGSQADVQAVVGLFTQAGITDELEAGRFLLKWDKYVP